MEGRAQAHPGGLRDDPGGQGEQHRLGGRRDGQRASDGGTDDRADAHYGEPARCPAGLGAEQRPGGQAFPERVHGQCDRDRRGSGQRDGGSLQEAVDRQRRRRAGAAGMLVAFLAAAPGAGGQARRR